MVAGFSPTALHSLTGVDKTGCGLSQGVALPLWQSRIRRVQRTSGSGERVVHVGCKLNWEVRDVREAKNRVIDCGIGGLPWIWSTLNVRQVAKVNWRGRKLSEIGGLQLQSCHQQHWKASPSRPYTIVGGLYIPVCPKHSQFMCYPGILSSLAFVPEFSFSHEVY